MFQMIFTYRGHQVTIQDLITDDTRTWIYHIINSNKTVLPPPPRGAYALDAKQIAKRHIDKLIRTNQSIATIRGQHMHHKNL